MSDKVFEEEKNCFDIYLCPFCICWEIMKKAKNSHTLVTVPLLRHAILLDVREF